MVRLAVVILRQRKAEMCNANKFRKKVPTRMMFSPLHSGTPAKFVHEAIRGRLWRKGETTHPPMKTFWYDF
jgi:hypothetical protein